MRVLHIINSYGGTEVYKNLITELDKLGVSQTVYVPLSVANRERVGNQLIDFRVKDSQIIYSTVIYFSLMTSRILNFIMIINYIFLLYFVVIGF